MAGVLRLHACESGFFNADEIRLVDEVTKNISFALDKLDEQARCNRAEEALRRSETLHRTLFESANDAVFLYPAGDLTANFIAVNQAACSRLGYSREELLRLGPRDVDPSTACDTNLRACDDKQTVFESVHLTRNGTRIPVEVSSVIFEQDGEMLSLNTARDITERKLAEAVLRESEARLKQAQQVAHTGDAIWDPATRSTVWSEELCRIAGRDPHQPLPADESGASVCSPEGWRRLQNAARKTLETGDPYDEEVEIVRPDGERRWIHARGVLVAGGDGRHRLHSTYQDITERKSAEDGARLTQAKLSALIESTTDLIWSCDLDCRLLIFNSAFQKEIAETFGTEAKVGRLLADLVPAKQAAEVERWYERVLKEGFYHLEYKLTRGRTIDVSLNPIISNGQLIGISAFGKDITERIELLETIQTAATEYRTLFDEALEGIFGITPEGRPLAANPALARILGFESVEHALSNLAGSTDELWVDARDRERHLSLVEAAGSISGYECRLRRKDGTHIWASLNTRRVCGADGRTVRYEGFIEDITERKRSNESLRCNGSRSFPV